MPKKHNKKAGTKKHVHKKKQFALSNLKDFLHIPYILVLSAIALSILIQSEIITLIIFSAIIVIFTIKKYDSRIPIGFALLLLVLSAIELALTNENTANQIAIYAYYYLVVGVLLQLIEYIKEKPKK